jgi:hypothetical protein
MRCEQQKDPNDSSVNAKNSKDNRHSRETSKSRDAMDCNKSIGNRKGDSRSKFDTRQDHEGQQQ